jgi:hypothetical protein
MIRVIAIDDHPLMLRISHPLLFTHLANCCYFSMIGRNTFVVVSSMTA